jgi:hypothetical protein
MGIWRFHIPFMNLDIEANLVKMALMIVGVVGIQRSYIFLSLYYTKT